MTIENLHTATNQQLRKEIIRLRLIIQNKNNWIYKQEQYIRKLKYGLK